MSLFKYLVRELLNNRRFSALFILNMTLGLAGFIALDGYKSSIDLTIKGRSKAVLGADFGVSARRPLSAPESRQVLTQMPSDTESMETIEMVSMVANKKGRSRLVQVKAIETGYPYYGEIGLEKSGVVGHEQQKELKEKPGVWIYPELIRQLDLAVGDFLKIGDREFQVFDVVVDDAAAGISTNMAPRIYMNIQYLKDTGLLREGSIAWYSRLYKIPGKTSDFLDQLREKIFKSLDSPEIKVFTHENASAQMVTLIARLNDFLGLSSLVALFLAAVGSSFLFHSYFNQRRKSIATLMTLGLSRWQAFSYYLSQVALLGMVSALFSIFVALALVPGLGFITKGLLPFQIEFFIDPLTVVFGILVGTLGSVLLSLPVLAGLKGLNPRILFSGESGDVSLFSLSFLLASLPGVLLLVALSIVLSHSIKLGLIFSGLFCLSALILAGLGWTLMRPAEKLSRRWGLPWSWVFRDLARQPRTTLTCFVTIGLGALLLNLVPQIQTSINSELQRPEESRLPSLFMFDIQEEQLGVFKNILSQESVEVDQFSPTIRARLVSVNGEAFDKGTGDGGTLTREEEREMRFRNRGFNLSYRSQLSESETLIDGKDFSGPYDGEEGGMAEISVEKRFADRLNFKMGDVLQFDIESVPITGKIINLRKVKWTSFQPNFFVQFQPGVLDMAPKTFIATLPGMTLDKKHHLQDLLVQKLPNISMVDVSRIVEKINEIIGQMSWALTFMAFLCLFSGFVVVYSIANHQSRQRAWEIGLLKALGASFSLIKQQLTWQFAMVGFLAVSAGALLSLALSFFLSWFVFESPVVFDKATPFYTIVAGSFIAFIVSQWATSQALKKPTRDLFS